MASESKIDDLQEAIQERANQLEDMDLNNLSVLYPLYQLREAMQLKEEQAMLKANISTEQAESFEDILKGIWNPEQEVPSIELWDTDTQQLSRVTKLQKKVVDWILEAKLQQLMSMRRDQELQEMQQKQISRPPDPLDIEEADDAEWRTSSAFKYLWTSFGEKAKDPEAFTEDMLSPKSAVPFLMFIFFDSLSLAPGVIETDIEASVDVEQLPSYLQDKVNEKRLFRVTDRDVDNWRFIPDEKSDDQVWKTTSGDIIVNGISECSEFFMGSVRLRQIGERHFVEGVSGNIWSRFSKGAYHSSRGIWFDAFVDICNKVGMPIGRTSSWILWNLVTNEELMRQENIDIIMCQEVRLLVEIKAVTFRDKDLGKDSEAGSWSLVLNSERIGRLRARGRAHPRPELLEEEQAEAAAAAAAGSEVADDNASEAPSASGSEKQRSGGRKQGKKKKKRAAAEKHVKIGAVKVSKLQTSNLLFLEHSQDTLTVQLMMGDKVEAVGSLLWKQTHEEALLSTDQRIELLKPVTKEKVGEVIVKLRLDDCYKEVFAALDSDETQQSAIQRMELRERASEVQKKKASAFLPEPIGQRPSYHSVKSGGTAEDQDQLQRRTVNDWEWGFADPVTVQENMLKVLNHTPFVSKALFCDFLQAAQIELPDAVIDSLWDDRLEKLCPLMLRWGEKIIAVRGLVLLSDCWKHLSRHIMLAGRRLELDDELKRTKPALATMSALGVPIGGVWFMPFYNTLMSTCQVVVPMDALKMIYQAHLDSETGLMPLDLVYDAIEKIGRPGLPYETFRNFIFALGIKIEPYKIALTFQQVDVNQNNCLDKAELRAGTLILLQQTVPLMLLEQQNLTIQHIVPHILAALSILGSLFAFLLLAFQSFRKKAEDGVFHTMVQSTLAMGLTAGVNSESSPIDLGSLKEFVIAALEKIFGVVMGSDGE